MSNLMPRKKSLFLAHRRKDGTFLKGKWMKVCKKHPNRALLCSEDYLRCIECIEKEFN